MEEVGKKFEKLVEVMEVLRGPNGCEWDKKQTHESLKSYIIEESYELIDAIERGDDKSIKEELGDVLLQVIFHAQIAKERGAFTIKDVIENITEKLIKRHPHVFGDDKGGYSYKKWEELKAKEKSEEDKASAIGKINKALPALSLARRIQENASAVGFDWEDIKGVWEKLREELAEFSSNPNEEELGDLLFTIVNISRFLNIDPEKALRISTEKFVKRFQKMEELIAKDKKDIEKLDIDEMEYYWKKAKEVV